MCDIEHINIKSKIKASQKNVKTLITQLETYFATMLKTQTNYGKEL